MIKQITKYHRMSLYRIHNPEVVGSWPTPDTLIIKELRQNRSSFFFPRELLVNFAQPKLRLCKPLKTMTLQDFSL